MRSRFVFFGLCCLVAVTYAASEQDRNLDSTSSTLEKKRQEQHGSTTTVKNSFDRTTERLQNQKESSYEATTKKQNQKEQNHETTTNKQNQKEQSHETTTKKQNQNEKVEKETSKPSSQESEQSSGNKQNEPSKDTEDDDKDVCFQHLGCFKMGKPWKSVLRPIATPDSPEKIQTTVHFYSRQNLKQPVYIPLYPEIEMGNARFDPKKKSVIIVHGFGSNGNASWVKEMKDAYLKEVDANVMTVDWGEGASHTNYLQVAGNTRVVGKELALFVQHLIKNYGAEPRKFHLIGHSLGAQISSYLAKEVPGIARLTALDPAQPGFEGFEKEVRLDKSDAEFVDVVHTDAKPFIPTLGFGMIGPQGHVDFYINGGYGQPGCILPEKPSIPITGLGDLAKYTVEALSDLVSCSHGRAHQYFIESLNKTDNCVFWGHKADPRNIFKSVTNTLTQGLLKEITALSPTCSKDDCIPLGFNTEKSPLRGIFVVTTNKKEPYCISEIPQQSKTIKLLNTVKENSKILGKLMP